MNRNRRQRIELRLKAPLITDTDIGLIAGPGINDVAVGTGGEIGRDRYVDRIITGIDDHVTFVAAPE